MAGEGTSRRTRTKGKRREVSGVGALGDHSWSLHGEGRPRSRGQPREAGEVERWLESAGYAES